MDRLDAIALFVRVVDSGSFSSAARSLGIGQPAISKQIASLEEHLGVQLLRRTSRRLTITEGGRDFYEAATRIVCDVEAAESRVGRGRLSPRGLVRAAVPPVLGRLYVVPRLPEFFARYPDVTIELVAADRLMNLLEEGFDIAVHHGELRDSSLIAKRMGQTPIVTVATPAYLAARGEPASPDELDRHACVLFAPQGVPRVWNFVGRRGPMAHHPTGIFRTNDAEQLRAAVLSDMGITHAPGWLFAAEIANGTVRRLLTAFEPAPLPISAVRPGDRFLASKSRVFIDFLSEIFAEEPNTIL
jgi:LysR family transcriptional regulator, regulator for bpeEF and oprC